MLIFLLLLFELRRKKNCTKPNSLPICCLYIFCFLVYMHVVSLYFHLWYASWQGVEKNLNKNCTGSLYFPELVLFQWHFWILCPTTVFVLSMVLISISLMQCIFPQYVLKYITSPFFILNSAYDVFQVRTYNSHASFIYPSFT